MGLWLGTGTLAGAAIFGALAVARTPEDRSEDASRIIESLTGPQQETDKLPAGALPALGGVGIDPSQTRLLGHSATLTYYGGKTRLPKTGLPRLPECSAFHSFALCREMTSHAQLCSSTDPAAVVDETGGGPDQRRPSSAKAATSPSCRGPAAVRSAICLLYTSDAADE